MEHTFECCGGSLTPAASSRKNTRTGTTDRPIGPAIGAIAATVSGAALVLLAVLHRDGAVYPIRARLEELTPGRALAIGLVGILVICALRASAYVGIAMPARERAASTERRLTRIRIGPAIALPIIVALSAALWTVLSAESTIPRVLGDELIYSGLGKSIALHGSYLLRGDRDVAHSQLYPLIISPAYALARNGANAHVAVQGLNAVMFSLAAVPTDSVPTSRTEHR